MSAKRIVITGTASGIGAATMAELRRLGRRVTASTSMPRGPIRSAAMCAIKDRLTPR